MLNFHFFIVFLCDNLLVIAIFLTLKKKTVIFLKNPEIWPKNIKNVSKRFGSVFLDPTEPKLRYSVNSVRSYTDMYIHRILHLYSVTLSSKSVKWAWKIILHCVKVSHDH